MNTDVTHDGVPPPLPAGKTCDRILTREPSAHLRRWPWLLVAGAGAAAAFDCALWAGESSTHGFGGYGTAVAAVLAGVSLVTMRRDLDFKSPLWLMLAATVVASAWVGSGISVVLVAALLLALVRRSSVEGESRGIPWFIAGPAVWCGACLGALGELFAKVFRGRSAAWVAAVATGVFFLVILAFGNAALAKYVSVVTRELAGLVSVEKEDVAHLIFWGVGVLGFGLLAAPLPRRKSAGVLVDVPAKAAPIAVAVLVGANLAFLASNIIDTYWIGFMRSAPAGVSTTDYLYDGAYLLMLDAAIAGALLLKLFLPDGNTRGDRRALLLGVALVAQCAWLGLGVAGRLALQMQKYGFTPVRLWGVVFLIWGFIGLWGVWRHLRTTPSFRAFVRLAAWSALGGLCVLQFRPPAVLSVDLNLACYRSHPEWKFDDAYYYDLGLDGWRLYRKIGHASPESSGSVDDAYWDRMFVGDRVPSAEDRSAGDDGWVSLDWRVRSLRHDALCEEWEKSAHP